MKQCVRINSMETYVYREYAIDLVMLEVFRRVIPVKYDLNEAISAFHNGAYQYQVTRIDMVQSVEYIATIWRENETSYKVQYFTVYYEDEITWRDQ